MTSRLTWSSSFTFQQLEDECLYVLSKKPERNVIIINSF